MIYRIQGSISIFLCLLRVALWHNIWSILEKDSHVAEKKAYLLFVGWNILYMSVKSKLLIVFLRSTVSSIFLEDLSSGVRGMLKSTTIILCCGLFDFWNWEGFVWRIWMSQCSGHRYLWLLCLADLCFP